MTTTFTHKAIFEGVITQVEADQVNAWIIENIKIGTSTEAPEELSNLIERILLCNYQTGVLQ